MNEDEKTAEGLDDNHEQIENQEVETTTEVKTWNIVDDSPEIHKSAFEKPAQEDVVEEVEKPIEEEVETVEEPIVNLPSIDEDAVKNYLKENYGIETDNLDALKPKEEKKLNAVVEKYQKFVEETGNESFEAFSETQRDWSQESEENVLKRAMKIERPHLSDEDINLLYEDKYAVQDLDPDFADQSEIRMNRLKEITAKDDYQKALELLEKQKEQYMVRRSSDETVPEEYRTAKELVDNWQKQQEESQILFEKQKADFEAKTNDVFNDKFEGFEVSASGQTFKVKPEDIAKAKSELSDLTNFDKKFFDETGLKDPKGYYKALYFGMNADKMAEHFINLGRTLQAEEDEKASKNIKVVGTKSVQSPMQNQGQKWTVVKD